MGWIIAAVVGSVIWSVWFTISNPSEAINIIILCLPMGIIMLVVGLVNLKRMHGHTAASGGIIFLMIIAQVIAVFKLGYNEFRVIAATIGISIILAIPGMIVTARNS